MTTNSRWRVFSSAARALVLALLPLSGCGVGYVVEPSSLNVVIQTEDAKQQLLVAVSGFLMTEGFRDFGHSDEMIELLEGSTAHSKESNVLQLARLYRERTYLNDSRHLRVVWTDFTHATPKELAELHYTPPSQNFIDISIYDERPGGFSTDGQSFYNRLLSSLKAEFGDSVVVMLQPPPTNWWEYWRLTLANLIGGAIAWSLAFLLSLLITGLLSRYLLGKIKVSIMAKRVVFVLVNTWLDAPLPFSATIVTIPAPNLLAFPWTDWNYYSHVAFFAAVSFSCALAICTWISTRMFKARQPKA